MKRTVTVRIAGELIGTVTTEPSWLARVFLDRRTTVRVYRSRIGVVWTDENGDRPDTGTELALSDEALRVMSSERRPLFGGNP